MFDCGYGKNDFQKMNTRTATVSAMPTRSHRFIHGACLLASSLLGRFRFGGLYCPLRFPLYPLRQSLASGLAIPLFKRLESNLILNQEFRELTPLRLALEGHQFNSVGLARERVRVGAGNIA